ncbi:hypothetical protein EG328_002941 [Venturia inaequalis]|uniref:Uncharacterized protein n=1 Tax=Venturia inaequalis TaxID=5025 RepID=A0A8H3ZA45_VENIN|nr:hypothetical protein EG328_002941 [Venturia inaequalis]KAE9988748.1 hypothetical protein EG327_003228 [Venturia inaequalis]RDI76560.1 hypothetical protein Vi05172_g13443 [Venturia inaequalis]
MTPSHLTNSYIYKYLRIPPLYDLSSEGQQSYTFQQLNSHKTLETDAAMAKYQPPPAKSDVWLYFVGLLLPPVPVFIKRGCAADFLCNICLSILGWFPGVLHCWFIISRSQRGVVEYIPYLDPSRRK